MIIRKVNCKQHLQTAQIFLNFLKKLIQNHTGLFTKLKEIGILRGIEFIHVNF